MELLYTHCAGIDVHQKERFCLRSDAGGDGGIGTAGRDPTVRYQYPGIACAGRLVAVLCGVRTVAMESTGVYFALSSALFGRVQVPLALG